MNFPLPNPRSSSLAKQEVIAQLREQARAIQPELPAGLHRRLASALAGLPPAPQPLFTRAAFRWLTLSAATLVAGALLAISLLRNHSASPTPEPLIAQTPIKPPPTAGFSPTPVALAQHWVDNPLETELRDLLNDVSRATGTVTSVLPAPRKSPPRAGDAGV